jgi:hypothetical protein
LIRKASTTSGQRILKLLELGDIHAGSKSGLLPDDFHDGDGNGHKQNAIQQFLWQCWRDLNDNWIPNIIGADPFALVIKGDIIEGCHHGSKEVITNDPQDHFEAAAELLEPLAAKAAAVYIIEGTECHTGNAERGMSRRLNAIKDPDTKKWAWPRLSLTIGGVRCIFQHHIGVTSRAWLEASALSIHLANEQIEAVRNGETMPRMLSCAHRHRYGEYRDASGLCCVTPPWQMLTRHGHKVVPSARTRPGALIHEFKGDGTLPITHVQTYRPPEPKGATL